MKSTYIVSFFTVLLILVSTGLFIFLNQVDPDLASLAQVIALYLLIFVFVFSGSFLVNYGIRRLFWPGAVKILATKSALRQGVLFGFLSVMILLFQSSELLNIWSSILLFVVFILIELYTQ